MHNSGDSFLTSRRLPKVREKLSSLVRRGSSLKLLDAAKRDRSRSQSKLLHEFTPLNVTLEELKPIRMGWEEDEERERQEQERKKKQQEEEERKKKEMEKKEEPKVEEPPSSTPIADMFKARRSTLDLLSFRNPASAETSSRSSKAQAPEKSERTPATEASSQDKRNGAAPAAVKRELVITTHYANGQHTVAPTKHAVKEVGLLKPVGAGTSSSTTDAFDASKRHSMPATPTVAAIRATLAAKTAAGSQDRRRSWQPPSPATSTFSQGGPPQAHSRLGAKRLAWIKELEEGRNGKNAGGDPVLKNLRTGGSVADKLASFEQKQHMPAMGGGLTRSNSIVSRVSMMDSSYAGGTTTARTSIDNGSHRASSVMDHYDDAFRERMESIAGNFAPKEDEEDGKPLVKVTSKFIEV